MSVTVAPYPTHSPLALCISRNSPTASCAADTDSHRNSCAGPGASGEVTYDGTPAAAATTVALLFQVALAEAPPPQGLSVTFVLRVTLALKHVGLG